MSSPATVATITVTATAGTADANQVPAQAQAPLPLQINQSNTGRATGAVVALPIVKRETLREQCIRRLTKEIKKMQENKPPFQPAQFTRIKPDPNNIQEFHFVLEGIPDTPYHGGFYHGIMRFPDGYPFTGPEVIMFTPSGRFPVNRPICSNHQYSGDGRDSDWSPAMRSWSIVVDMLYSFMSTQIIPGESLDDTTDEEKRAFALQSLDYNYRNSSKFRELFPELVEKNNEINTIFSRRNTLRKVALVIAAAAAAFVLAKRLWGQASDV